MDKIKTINYVRQRNKEATMKKTEFIAMYCPICGMIFPYDAVFDDGDDSRIECVHCGYSYSYKSIKDINELNHEFRLT